MFFRAGWRTSITKIPKPPLILNCGLEDKLSDAIPAQSSSLTSLQSGLILCRQTGGYPETGFWEVQTVCRLQAFTSRERNETRRNESTDCRLTGQCALISGW